MCDKKNSVLFTDTECVVLSPDFKLTDESHVLLKVPRKDNMYSVDLKNVVPQGGLTCLFAKATPDESNLWHRRLGHVNFKTMNKLVRGNLVRGLPLKLFEINQTCVACQKGKQHRASCRKPALSFRRPFRCPVTILNTIDHLGTKACDDASKARMETVPDKDYILLPMWPADLLFSQNLKDSPDARLKPLGEEEKKDAKDPGNESGNPTEGKDNEVPSTEEPRINQEKDDNINSTNNINTASDGNNTNNVNVVSSTINSAEIKVNAVDPKTSIELPNDPNMPELEDIVYSDDDEDVGAEADMNNLDAFIPASPIPTTRIHKDHPIEAMQYELLQFKLQKGWTLVDLPNGKRAIRTKWVYRNKKNERGIVIKNKARLVAQGYTQEEGIDSDEIEEAVYACQPPGFEDPDFPVRRGKIDKTLFIRRVKSDILLVQVNVDDIIFSFTKKSLCIEFEKMMYKKFQMSSMGELTFFLGLQVKQKEDGIFISQDKYVTKILKKFSFTDVKTAGTPMETHKPLLKDTDGKDVDEHLYRSMIRSLMYLTSSRPAYTDSDYAGASLDRKSTTGGCQFLGCRLISRQCKKQTVVANSLTKAEYIPASNCCRQVL
ncbi:putative ribonuclease H-like domain-containing protein [Tanacetum coccineum]